MCPARQALTVLFLVRGVYLALNDFLFYFKAVMIFDGLWKQHGDVVITVAPTSSAG